MSDEDDGPLSPEEEFQSVALSVPTIILRHVVRLMKSKGLLDDAEARLFLFQIAEHIRSGSDAAGTESTAYYVAQLIERIAEE